MSDAIQAAIAAAKANAGAAVTSAETNLPATTGSAPPPAPMPQRGVAMSMDDLMIGSMSVDAWLKVKEFGLLIGTDATLITAPIQAAIDMTAIHPNYSIKFGDPAQYEKTYDRSVTAKGGSWYDAVRRAQQIEPKAREYRSADVPMTLLEDVVVNGKVICEAGKTLGKSLSTTEWPYFEAFYKAVLAAGLKDQAVKVEIFFERRVKGNTAWGVVTFKFLGPLVTN
jgi:hypothetical protein